MDGDGGERENDEGLHWQEMIVDPNLTIDEIITGHYNAFGMNDGPLTKKTHGVKERFTNEMRDLDMKISYATTNLSRYQALCKHFVPEQRQHADPKIYKRFPILVFGTYSAFWLYHFAWFFAFFEYPSVQFILSMVLLWQMHLWSHYLYMIPLPQVFAPYSCAMMPLQWHCEILNVVQQNTFSGITDMKKAFFTLLTRIAIASVTSLVSRKLKV